MASGWIEIRRSGLGAACALMLSVALISSASARQDSSTAASNPKPATTSSTQQASPKAHSSAVAGSTSSAKTHLTSGKKTSKKKSARVRGQQKIDSERAQEIQEALIREHYLTGEPTGKWNEASEAAMRRYQSDHGWQSKTVPDSRALIKLGLGPSKDHLLNPESAMTTAPDPPRSGSTKSGSAAPADSNSPKVDGATSPNSTQQDSPPPH